MKTSDRCVIVKNRGNWRGNRVGKHGTIVSHFTDQDGSTEFLVLLDHERQADEKLRAPGWWFPGGFLRILP